MKSRLLLLISILLMAVAAEARLVVIADIDDTISATHVRNGLNYFPMIMNSLIGYNAFTGMPGLFNQLAGNGTEFEYVSSRSAFFTGLGTSFLEETGFPAGRLSVNSKIPMPTAMYKTEKLIQIMRERPHDQFILIGDNGQYDSDVYADLYLNREFRSRIRQIYIHKVYAAPVGKLPVIGQGQFYTTSDLAVNLHQAGVLSEAQTLTVLAQVQQGLSSPHRRVRNLTLPKFQDISGIDMAGLEQRARTEKNPRLRASLTTINELIKNLRPGLVATNYCDGIL